MCWLYEYIISDSCMFIKNKNWLLFIWRNGGNLLSLLADYSSGPSPKWIISQGQWFSTTPLMSKIHYNLVPKVWKAAFNSNQKNEQFSRVLFDQFCNRCCQPLDLLSCRYNWFACHVSDIVRPITRKSQYTTHLFCYASTQYLRDEFKTQPPIGRQSCPVSTFLNNDNRLELDRNHWSPRG